MAAPTLKFSIDSPTITKLEALAASRNLTMAQVLKNLVYREIYGTPSNTGTKGYDRECQPATQ
jgi:hypothetical protein